MLQNQLQSVVDRTGVERHILIYRRREHPAGVHCFLILLQHRHHGGRQDDLADGVLRLGRADLKLAPHIVDLLVHGQGPGFEIQVVPLEGQQFAPAKASG